MRQRKFGFTLAEVMIVLSVIGILSAILMPIAFKSSPDKNIMKFKKAHNVLHSSVRELVSSGKYYMPGYLGLLPNGEYPNGITIEENGGYNLGNFYARYAASFTKYIPETLQYFCNAFADIVSAKAKSCTFSSLNSNHLVAMFDFGHYIVNDLEKLQKNVSLACLSSHILFSNGYNSFTTNDNVFFYEYGNVFGAYSSASSCPSGSTVKADDFGYNMCVDKSGFDFQYQPICIDIDGIDGPVKPFGYGIRSDGKIITGSRAQWWLERDITKKETDCCPKTLNDNGLCDEGDIVCTE